MNPAGEGATLTVSVVTYAPDMQVLGATLRSLDAALAQARRAGVLRESGVTLVDNGPGADHTAPLQALGGEALQAVPCRVLSGHGNVGYGLGHNLPLLASEAEFHLVLNPDVLMEPDALEVALRFMRAHPGTLMLAPAVRGPDGAYGHLCKRYPSLLDLALRGFAPERLKRVFARRLARYELRDLPGAEPALSVPIISGSFMFVRRAPVAALGGFSAAFFMYFEDFDLSVRVARVGRLAFVPAVKIVHLGGHASRKGLRHILMFARSALTFFRRNGWKLA